MSIYTESTSVIEEISTSEAEKMEGEIKPQDLDSLVREADVIVEEAQVRQLYAGLAVRARDMHQYLAEH